jgi:uncharacterized membrane protein
MMRKDSFHQDEKPGGERTDEPCWFCKRRNSKAACAVEVPMYGNVVGSGKTAEFSTARIRVPRCAGCKTVHAKVEAIMTTGIGVGLTVGVVIIVYYRVHEIFYSLGHRWGLDEGHVWPSTPRELPFVVLFYGFPFICPMITVVTIVGLIFSYFGNQKLERNGVIDEDLVDQFPIIAERIAKGWKKGEKP